MEGLVSRAAEYLAANIRTLKEAPLVFFVLVLVAFAAAYLAAGWRYAGILEQRSAAIDTLRARLEVAERSAAELREQLAAASQPTAGRDPEGAGVS